MSGERLKHGCWFSFHALSCSSLGGEARDNARLSQVLSRSARPTVVGGHRLPLRVRLTSGHLTPVTRKRPQGLLVTMGPEGLSTLHLQRVENCAPLAPAQALLAPQACCSREAAGLPRSAVCSSSRPLGGESGGQRPFCLCKQSGPRSTAWPDSAVSFVSSRLAARPGLQLAEDRVGAGSPGD